MPHIPDGHPCAAIPAANGHPLIAIGWLDAGHPFQSGPLPEGTFNTLCDHLSTRWEPPFAYAGFHHCNLCQFATFTRSIYRKHEFSSNSSAELFIPTGTSIFVTPVSIAHYIDAHSYLPPQEFLEALIACPPQRSIAYMKLLLDSGGRDWLKSMQ